MFKKALCLWLILIVVLSTAACAPKGGDTKKTNDTNASGSDAQAPDSLKTFVTNLSADPTTFNPVFKADDDGHLIYQNVFDGLLELNFNSEVIPGLAETWEASEDGKTYTFHLAKGIKWHDGVAFSSDDVKYTYERIMTDHGFIGETLSHALESIECPDPDTVVLKLKEPDATLLGTLAWYEHFIIPKHIYEKEADWATAEAATVKPIGTGPFKFVSHKKGESITLEANDEYFKGRPLIDRLVYTIIPDANTATMAFRNGEIDLLCGVPTAEVPSMQSDPDIKIGVMSAARRYQLIFNMENEKVKEFAIRKAVALGIDRDEISVKGTHGLQKPAYGFYPPFLEWAYNKEADIGARDVSGARKYLEDAGFTQDANGNYLSLELDVFSGGTYADCAKVIQANLKDVGIDLKINVMEMAAWAEKIDSGNFEVAMLAGYQGPDPDAITKRIGTGQVMNWAKYSNKEVDNLLAEAKKLVGHDERGALYKKVQEILGKELPIIPIVEFANFYAARKDVSGVPYIDQVADVHDNSYAKVNIG